MLNNACTKLINHYTSVHGLSDTANNQTGENIMTSQFKQREVSTMVIYTSVSNKFNTVLIKSDDSFVIVGDHDVSDLDLVKMTNWEDVEGFTAY